MLASGAHKLDSEERTKDVYISENINFEGLLLSEPTLTGLSAYGFEKPSPIQYKAIPFGRCGFDLIAQAKSGTGKTCMFGVIALEMLQLPSKSLQVLILAPTREIAAQVADVITSIGEGHEGLQVATFIGGMPLEEDRRRARKCHIAVGSPGRVKQLIDEKVLDIEHVRLVVLDEADKLLEPGFLEDINHIFSLLPESKQTLAASATYTDELKSFLENYMRNPIRVSPESLQLDGVVESTVLLGVRQRVGFITFHPNMLAKFKRKLDALVYLLSCVPFKQCLVFNNLHGQAESMSKMLNSKGFPTEFISGHMEQPRRLKAIANLVEFKCRVLLSTDLSARGLDAANVDLVINMDIPQNEATYLHRVGRAGRFGSKGLVITLSENSGKDIDKLCNISTKIHVNFDCFNVDIKEPLNFDLWSSESMISFDEIINQKTNKKMDVKKENGAGKSKEIETQKVEMSANLDMQEKVLENELEKQRTVGENGKEGENDKIEKTPEKQEIITIKENINDLKEEQSKEAEKTNYTDEENINKKSTEKVNDENLSDFHSAVDSSDKDESDSSSEESDSQSESDCDTKEQSSSDTSEKESDSKTTEDENSDASKSPVKAIQLSVLTAKEKLRKEKSKRKLTKNSTKLTTENEPPFDEITCHGDVPSKMLGEKSDLESNDDIEKKNEENCVLKNKNTYELTENKQYNYTPKSQQSHSGYQRNYTNRNTYAESPDTPRMYNNQHFGNRYVYPTDNPHIANYYALQNSSYPRQGGYTSQEHSPREHYPPKDGYRGRGYNRDYTDYPRLNGNYSSPRGNFRGSHDGRPSFRTYDMTKSLARLFQDIRAYKLPEIKEEVLGFETLERLQALYVPTSTQVSINESYYPKFHYTFLLTALRKYNGEQVIKTKEKFVKHGGTVKYLTLLADGYESETEENEHKSVKVGKSVNYDYTTMPLTPFIRIQRSEWTLGAKVDEHGNVIQPENENKKSNEQLESTDLELKEMSKEMIEIVEKKSNEEEDSELLDDAAKKSPENLPLESEDNESKISESDFENDGKYPLYCKKSLEKTTSLESICASSSQASDVNTEVDKEITEEQQTTGDVPQSFNPYEYPPLPTDPAKLDLWKQQVKLTTFMIHYGKYMEYMYAPKE